MSFSFSSVAGGEFGRERRQDGPDGREPPASGREDSCLVVSVANARVPCSSHGGRATSHAGLRESGDAPPISCAGFLQSSLVDRWGAANILGCSPSHASHRMWAHGFDPMVNVRLHMWWREHVVQVKAERVAWKLDEDPALDIDRRVTLRMGTMEEQLLPDLSRSFDRDKHAEARARLREQLDAGVSAADLDYLASRAGERRRNGQTHGVTAHLLAGMERP